MLEIALLIGAVIIMAKIASAEDRSAFLWGLITLVICGVSLIIPLPFIRILIALSVSFGILFILKLKNGK